MRFAPYGLAAALLLAVPHAVAGSVALIDIHGTINPATAGFIDRAVQESASRQAECLIIRLDTPGGLLDSTKSIVQTFYRSPVPIVVYVAPSGANATSAGCFITLAADIAAMAPNTSIGAAHPVGIGGQGEMDEVMKQKLENFAVSYIETIAEKRGRNVDWAKSSVRESASITSETALADHVIDIIADDIPDLLKKIDGRTVDNHILKTAGAEVRTISMSPVEQAFHLFWRPEVLMLLMLIAIYGILGEISNPGGIIPGVVGVVALMLALYMSAAVPINVAGLILMILAVGLFVAEAFTPTFGLLTAGGAISFFFGLLLLFDRANPLFHLSLAFIIPTTILTVLFFVFVVSAGLRAQFLPVRAGRETLIGRTAPAVTDINANGGKVLLEGSYWNAVSTLPVAAGQYVRITAIDGLTLTVIPTGPPDSP